MVTVVILYVVSAEGGGSHQKAERGKRGPFRCHLPSHQGVMHELPRHTCTAHREVSTKQQALDRQAAGQTFLPAQCSPPPWLWSP